MGADLQFKVPYGSIGTIFDKVVVTGDKQLTLLRETKECKFTLLVDISDLLDNTLSRSEFDYISSTRSLLEKAEMRDDEETILELKRDLEENFTSEQISNYDEFSGDYEHYAEFLGKKILEDLSAFESDLEHIDVFVEVWL